MPPEAAFPLSHVTQVCRELDQQLVVSAVAVSEPLATSSQWFLAAEVSTSMQILLVGFPVAAAAAAGSVAPPRNLKDDISINNNKHILIKHHY